jgi:hypothetical protein
MEFAGRHFGTGLAIARTSPPPALPVEEAKLNYRSFKNSVWPLLLMPLLLLVTLPGGAVAEVLVSEVLADAVSDWSGDGEVHYKMDEWIDIHNFGGSVQDLSGFWISDSVDDPTLRYRFSGELAAGASLHLVGADVVAWQAETGNGSAGLSLNNSGGFVALFRDDGDDTVLIDAIEYLGYQIEDDRAFGRSPIDREDWILYDGLNIYHGSQEPGSTGCMPSPGEVNRCDSVPVREAAWGQLKSFYSVSR